MKLTSKDERLLALYKMDCVSLQGVWPTFVQSTPTGFGRAVAAARMYAHLLEEERRRLRQAGRPVRETPAEVRRSLLVKIEERIVREDADDEAVLLLLTS